ncbi:MAG TPA: hypothetical protein VLD67_01260 [Vicinamibacterales bacterium]|nr:hypothetical protein [Vicinamibacterales bacterium]
MASSAALAICFLRCTGTLRLQRRKVGEAQLTWRLPGGPFIPLSAAALVVAMTTTLTLREVMAVGVVVLLAGVTFVLSRRRDQSA